MTPFDGLHFSRVAPTLGVSNMQRSLAFYTGALRMQKTFENGNPTGFAILKRDAVEIHLSLVKNYVAPHHNVVHLLVSDAKTLHDHCVTAGVHIIKGLRDQEYGLRDFVIADPDGNRIDIGQTL